MPRQGIHRPANANNGRSSLKANHFGVLRGFVSAYSQNDVAGTMQRLPQAPGRPAHDRRRAQSPGRDRREKLQMMINSRPRSMRNDLLPTMELQALAIADLNMPKHMVRKLDQGQVKESPTASSRCSAPLESAS
jgi:hypothetical protein